MDQKERLIDFFAEETENELNKQIRTEPSNFDEESMLLYVREVCLIPLKAFIAHIIENPTGATYNTPDISQSSKPENCHRELCRVFESKSYEGLTTLDLGALLENDGKERSPETLRRYGLDQARTARQLGLTKLYGKKWYVSCIGRIFLRLEQEEQQAIMARCILRDVYYSKLLIQATKNNVDFESTCLDLTPDTINRRKASVKYLFEIVRNASNDNIFYELVLPVKNKK